ncbi:extracellular solute-binding protein [Cohnella terricola]|uniref:Extracellular solute-binding protein n=1 Tax=Cohnella terricola TaxID=1289167 RepID=A0A559J7U9_9BACL|nr:extracellular solute-binding protein [Cohnella terricola]TVX95927.1 extracellular solute-binding protein [Cohnella terricola]
MKQKRLAYLMFAAVLCLTVALSGCSKSNSANGTKAPAEANTPTASDTPSASNDAEDTASNNVGSDPVTLKIVVPGTKEANYEPIKQAVEKKLAADGQNTKIDFIYVDWSDLEQKTKVMLASGENIDLIFDAPWLHMNQMIAAGYYEDLSDLLNKFGSNVLKNRSQQMWDANTFNGKTMGIPLGIYLTQGHSINIRKDLREELGLPPVKTWDDVVKFAYAVKEKYPKITPYWPHPSDITYSVVNWQVRDDSELQMRPTGVIGADLVLNYKGNDGKVFNLFDEMEPKVWDMIIQARKMYTDKIINQDTLTTKLATGDALQQGKAAAAPIMLFGLTHTKDQMSQAGENAEVESVRLFDFTPGKNISNFAQDNFVAIPKASKNKERAMMFLDWANANEENYMLVEHGIEGTDWEKVGDKKFKQLVPGKDVNGGGLASFSLVWNPVLEKTIDTDDDETMKANDFIKVADNFTKDILTGFTFDSAPVKNEIAQYGTVQAKYYMGIFNGVLDPDKYWDKYKKEGSAPLKKIQTELQKQIDAFLASK